MNNKLNNMLNEFLENSDIENEEDIQKYLDEFIVKYNNDDIEYENTPLDDAYDLLEKASNAKTKKEAISLAKKAYNTSSACFDAKLFLFDLEENTVKANKILDDSLAFEKKRLETDGFFDDDNIGHFYGIYETRPYIRGLYIKARTLSEAGKYKKAVEVCKEILRLNNKDNTGARYMLMALYALLEEEKSMLDLYKRYKEEHLEMLFPIFVLYYKKEDNTKAKKYLDKINKANKNFVKFYKGNIKLEDNIIPGCYFKGEASEVFMYMEDYAFLADTLNEIDNYIIENSKNK